MRAKRTIAVISAFLGLALTTAGPAAAGTNGKWVPYGNDNPILGSSSKWVCGGSKEISTNMLAQVCVIRSNGGNGDSVQGAVIVRNNRSTLASASAQFRLQNPTFINEWTCLSSGVAARSWSVCFGTTGYLPMAVYATGNANNTSLGYTGDI